ncbi:hypothetical protein VNO77_15049 [Canavalia gladiata]|uniref:F-box domain-containing protein n=1 Tax=Canavalia gladiata TaxID=3824 RepID=A0AAN9LZ76_CANGL
MEKSSEEGRNYTLLDFHESILEFILKRLSSIELCAMSEVCTSSRDICQSDHFWENHLKQKWGKVIGDAAYKEWQWHITAAKEGNFLNQRTNGSLGSFTGAWPNLCLGSYLEDSRLLLGQRSNNFLKSLYLSLESGTFWFPAQIYENSARGLMVHSALIRYDSESNTFGARCQTAGWQFLAKDVEWNMVRIPSVDSPPNVVHISDCLENLKPEDHIEIQRRATRRCPYDWWYGVIGHLDSCNQNYCACQYSDTLIVEFRQYSESSNMRRIGLSRKNNGEQGDQIGGYYGGIRKLHNEDEIETWKKLFPLQIQRAPIFYLPPVAAEIPIPQIL